MKKPVILCVDDEKPVLETLHQQISKSLGREFEIDISDSGEEALEIVWDLEERGRELALVISDQIMPGMKGDELLINIHSCSPDTLKILLTGQASLEAVQNAINNAQLYRYVSKPWEINDLLLTVMEAARSYQQRAQLLEYDHHNRLLRALNRATQDISSEMTLDGVLDRFLNNAYLNTGIERLFVVLGEEGKMNLSALRSCLDSDQRGLQSMNDKTPEELLQYVITEIESAKVSNSRSTFSMALPLKKKGAALGYVLAENHSTRGLININQREILEMLTSQVAISVDNALLYQHLDGQKRVIEEKNQDITDSIRYAMRIQNALLPGQALLQQHFADHFVLYQPKHIVSGDFYWFAERDGYFFIAVADCTGHGIPGALVSVLGSTQLNEIVQQRGLISTDEILNELSRRISNMLNQGQANKAVQDGMDIALCRFSPDRRMVQFSGANRTIFHRQCGQLQEHNADRLPIGHSDLHAEEAGGRFTALSFVVNPGDVLYLFSDGVCDQFGGEEGRKFSKRRFREILEECQAAPLSEQGKAIWKALETWRGETEQTDDITVVGIEIAAPSS